MRGSMEAVGLDSLFDTLNTLSDKAEAIASQALYDGAGVMADAMSRAADSIRTAPYKYAEDGEKRLPSPEEKAAIKGRVGIAKFNKSGAEVDTIIGLTRSGYVHLAGERKAVQLIARSIESGTSFMEKQPVFRKAARTARGAAEAAIVKKADQVIKEMTK